MWHSALGNITFTVLIIAGSSSAFRRRNEVTHCSLSICQAKVGTQILLIRKSQKIYIVRKSQIRKLLHLRKVRKSIKNIVRKFADLRLAELICGPPTFVAKSNLMLPTNCRFRIVKSLYFSLL